MGKKTESGSYRGKVRIGYTSEGKPIDKYISAPTKADLDIALQACKEHYILGRPLPEEKLFYEYAEEWYKLRKEPFISEASRSSYKSSQIKSRHSLEIDIPQAHISSRLSVNPDSL